VNLLHEAGLVSQTGMGVAPLEWKEICAWLDATELSLSVWEKLTIKTLSEAYAAEYNQASDPNRAAPFVYVDEDIQAKRDVVASKIGSILRARKKS
jgi:hypothetical protein